MPLSQNHSRTSDAKVTSILANGRHACHDHDSQGIVKHAMSTRHMRSVRKWPSRKSLSDLRQKSYSNLANGRHSYRDHDSQDIVKRATTTRRISTLRTCPFRRITPGPPTQKLHQFSRMAATPVAIMILKVL